MSSAAAACVPDPMDWEPQVKNEDYEDETAPLPIQKPRTFILVKDYSSKVVDEMIELRFPARRIKHPATSQSIVVLEISIGIGNSERPNCCLVSMDDVGMLADWINGEEGLGETVMLLKFRPDDDPTGVVQKDAIPALRKIHGVKRVECYDSGSRKSAKKLVKSMLRPASEQYEWEMLKVDALRLRANLHFRIWLAQRPGGSEHFDAAGEVFSKMIDRVDNLFRQMCKAKPGECKPIPSDKDHKIYMAMMSICSVEFYRWDCEKANTNKQDWDWAAEVIKKVCLDGKTDPNVVSIVSRHLCAVQLKRGRFGEAQKLIEKAIKVAPTVDNINMLKEAKKVTRQAGYTWRRVARKTKRKVAFKWGKRKFDGGEAESQGKAKRPKIEDERLL